MGAVGGSIAVLISCEQASEFVAVGVVSAWYLCKTLQNIPIYAHRNVVVHTTNVMH